MWCMQIQMLEKSSLEPSGPDDEMKLRASHTTQQIQEMLESSSIRVLAPLTGLACQVHIGDFLAEFGSAKEIMVTSSLVHIYLY